MSLDEEDDTPRSWRDQDGVDHLVLSRDVSGFTIACPHRASDARVRQTSTYLYRNHGSNITDFFKNFLTPEGAEDEVEQRQVTCLSCLGLLHRLTRRRS